MSKNGKVFALLFVGVLGVWVYIIPLPVHNSEVEAGVTEATEQEDPFSSAAAESKSLILKVTTVGNHSFVEMNFDGPPSWRVKDILTTLNEFEENNPQLKVVNWHTQFIGVGDLKFGFWVDHRAKKEK